MQVHDGNITSVKFYVLHFRYFQYGRLGVVFGHEVTHGFDSNGMRSDLDSFILSVHSLHMWSIGRGSKRCYTIEQWRTLASKVRY